MLFALTPQKSATRWQIDSVDIIDADEILPDDKRVFVTREADVDWVAEAIEAHLNRPEQAAA